MIVPFIDQASLPDLPQPVILADCRWYLDGRSGRAAYDAGHLPSAVFVDLDADLAGPADETTGRHPLPTPEAFADALSRLGISPDSTVVAYDDAGGVIAARLVWMLRAVGQNAAVLDGGVAAWSGALSTEAPALVPTQTQPRAWPSDLLADLDDTALAGDGQLVFIDARPRERFAGTAPEIDARAGHIPGARSLPCRDNLDTDDHLLPVGELRSRLADVGVTEEVLAAGRLVSSCGSGVTACHNLLVIEHVGLGRGRLYPGSWSQYSATDRPSATGL